MNSRHSTLFSLLLVLASALGATAQSNWTDKSPHKPGFISVNGVRLHYLDWGGNGETMLLLHGLGDTPHIFDDLAPKFTNQFRVLGLTRRGHGQSEIPEAGYDTATLVEDIRQFLDSLKIQRAVLVGHSIAGDELTRFAVVHPDHVIKLVYLDAAYDRTRMPEIMKQHPPELMPTKTEGESLDGMRAFTKRINNAWSEAWEATLREHFSSDGKALPDAAKRGRAINLVAEGSLKSHADYAKISVPALSFAVIGFSSKLSGFVKTLPDPARQRAEMFLSGCREYMQQESEHLAKRFQTAESSSSPTLITIALSREKTKLFVKCEDFWLVDATPNLQKPCALPERERPNASATSHSCSPRSSRLRHKTASPTPKLTASRHSFMTTFAKPMPAW